MATPDQATGVSDADITGTVIEAIDSFDAMGLSEPLLRGIYAYGFEKPSAIQQRAIKPLMSGQDTIAQAQSGTGKTATFTIGAQRRTRHHAPPAPQPAAACAPASSAVPRRGIADPRVTRVQACCRTSTSTRANARRSSSRRRASWPRRSSRS